MGLVFVRESLIVAWSAGQTVLKKGDVWDADADLVRERPELFSEETASVRGRKAEPPVVERATRAPGEMRRTPPRTQKKNADKKNVDDTSGEAGSGYADE